MKKSFPPKYENYLQTNRSDILGNLWATFNIDFQSNLRRIRLANKLVTNTTSVDDADLGLPVAFEFFYNQWWAVCGTRIFKNGAKELTTGFIEDTSAYQIGTSTTQFDVTNPSGTTFRYTYDGTGTDPGITALTFPIGSTVVITGTNLAAGNRGTFTITGSGANYFEVTNAGGVVESNKTIGTGNINISGGSFGRDYSISSDLLVFNDKLWATSSLYLRSKTDEPGVWITKDTFVSAVPHPLVYFKKFDRLYMVNESASIHSIDTSEVVATSGDYTLNPGRSIGYITCMEATTDYIWIGTFRDNSFSIPSSSEVRGSIMQWDGFSQQVINEFVIDAGGVLAMCVVSNVPYAIDCEGRILKYTGYSFTEIARLPIDRILLVNPTTVAVNHFIHFNGMVGTKNNTILVLINNLNDDASVDVSENLPSGIWELDLATNNFTHKYAPTLKARSSSTVTDFGQNRISAPGALKLNYLQSNSANGRSTLIAGCTVITNDGSALQPGIYIDSPAKPNTDNEGQKRGYFVTTWFNSDEITEKWARVWATFKRFLNSTDKIIFKYRFTEEPPFLCDIAYFSSTTIAVDASQSSVLNYAGYEVEILAGPGSGACYNITSVTGPSGGYYTVTVDTPIIGFSVISGSKARFQKWIKLGEITGQVLQYGQLPIGFNDTRIQIKVVLEFTGNDEFHKFILISNNDLDANS